MVCPSMKWQATKCGDVRLTQRLSREPHHSTKWEPIGHATSTFQIILRARARKSWERLHIHARTRYKVSLHCSAGRLSKLKLRSWESSLKGACLMMNQCHCRYIEHSWVGGHDQSSYLGMFLLCLTSSVSTSSISTKIAASSKSSSVAVLLDTKRINIVSTLEYLIPYVYGQIKMSRSIVMLSI